MNELTEKQLTRLAEVAKDVKGTYASLPIEEILNRIHFITNADFKRSLTGLRQMLQHRFIVATFIVGLERIDQLERMIDVSFPILAAVDAQLTAPGTFASQRTVTELDGPTDDEPEDDGWETRPLNAVVKSQQSERFEAELRTGGVSVEKLQIDLSHLNANF